MLQVLEYLQILLHSKGLILPLLVSFVLPNYGVRSRYWRYSRSSRKGKGCFEVERERVRMKLQLVQLDPMSSMGAEYDVEQREHERKLGSHSLGLH